MEEFKFNIFFEKDEAGIGKIIAVSPIAAIIPEFDQYEKIPVAEEVALPFLSGVESTSSYMIVFNEKLYYNVLARRPQAPKLAPTLNLERYRMIPRDYPNAHLKFVYQPSMGRLLCMRRLDLNAESYPLNVFSVFITHQNDLHRPLGSFQLDMAELFKVNLIKVEWPESIPRFSLFTRWIFSTYSLEGV